MHRSQPRHNLAAIHAALAGLLALATYSHHASAREPADSALGIRGLTQQSFPEIDCHPWRPYLGDSLYQAWGQELDDRKLPFEGSMLCDCPWVQGSPDDCVDRVAAYPCAISSGAEYNGCDICSISQYLSEPAAAATIGFASSDYPRVVRGQSDSGSSGGGDLAAAAQNPVANLAAFPLQSNWNFGIGPQQRTQYVGLFQPVIPWKLGDDWNLITRAIVPFVNAPVGFDSNADGLGDSQGQFFFTPNTDSKFIWGVGPLVVFPTASDPALGFGEWAVGLDAVGLVSTGRIVAGALITQAWGVDGNNSPFLVQPFFNYNFQKGYFVNASGEARADWELPKGSRWLFPLGAGVGRTFAIAGQPLTLSTRFAPYLESPAGGPEWQFRFLVSFLYPK